eukprot:1957552-Heterocapsa_arctica.AAC.1
MKSYPRTLRSSPSSSSSSSCAQELNKGFKIPIHHPHPQPGLPPSNPPSLRSLIERRDTQASGVHLRNMRRVQDGSAKSLGTTILEPVERMALQIIAM